MIKYFEISTGTPPLYLAESKEQKGVEIISWIGSEFYKGESAENAVLYEAQNLTSSQQLQARTNIGLANVDNTRDKDKPISTATQQALDGKQDTLTLTTLSNGNIRIGNLAGTTKDFMPATPSGDPMHYAYEEAGAVWNSSTGYWELNGILDLSNADMRTIYISTLPIYNGTISQYICSYSTIRTNIPNRNSTQLTHYSAILNCIGLFRNCTALEIVKFTTDTSIRMLNSNNFQELFRYCNSLWKVIGGIDLSYTTNTNAMFQGCSSLQSIELYGVKTNIDLSDCASLSKASILYMVQNAGTATITITLHATAYAMAMADSDIQSALAVKTNVSLASA